MTEFRRFTKRESEEGLMRYSATDMAKCPIILRDKKLGLSEYVYTDATREIFAEGSKIHELEGVWREGARGHLNTELGMRCVKKDKAYVFSGYQDFKMINENGMYIEDLKSCNRNAFYFFNNEKGSYSERLQVSAYRWLYYVVFGVIIEHAVITKIDRDNTLNRFSLEVEMLSINDFESFLINHPTVLFLQDKITERTFQKRTKDYIKQERWLCKYCDRSEKCKINIALTKTEKTNKK